MLYKILWFFFSFFKYYSTTIFEIIGFYDNKHRDYDSSLNL